MNDQDQGKYDRDRAKADGMTKREKLRLFLGREPTDEEAKTDYAAGLWREIEAELRRRGVQVKVVSQ